jgi:flagellar basal-body rod protein FlgB
MGFFADVTNRAGVPALEKMLAFTQARHQILTENVANADTPGYKARQVDAAAFQRSLRDALTRQDRTRSPDLELKTGKQFRLDRDGRLAVTPTESPPENILFHDGTNIRIERQMAHLAENAMMHQATTEMLRGKFEGLMKAITGRAT